MISKCLSPVLQKTKTATDQESSDHLQRNPVRRGSQSDADFGSLRSDRSLWRTGRSYSAPGQKTQKQQITEGRKQRKCLYFPVN